ncbi:hypothetical protein KEM09_15270 [Carboxylicivirga mesophila]|uniref:EamA domain-containing protein n=1 Tax=Carboxylicivirga mesophila TaxID=1166478 RepID=A0ABS5KCX7_9BACT|nr:hypothetical protein [Carboxylicivirga mesophila]MBS2212779.1 hypothetical protein [Carboxylicivirga mesophila]
MVPRIKKSRLEGIPAWALSLMVAFASWLFLILLFDETGVRNLSSLYLLSISLLLVVFFAVACFFICKTYPGSVWYTPLICNTFIITSFIFDMPFWTRSQLVWIMLGIGFLLSFVGAIAGASKGKIHA